METANPRADFRMRSQSIGTVMAQVQSEYQEMPGLSVTLPQARRLWSVDQAMCEEVFGRLVAKGVVKKTTKGQFVRA